MAKLVGECAIHVCDVEHEDQIARLRDELAATGTSFPAWSTRSPSPTTQTACSRSTKRQAGVSAGVRYLVLLAGRPVQRLKDLLDPDASVVTISISTTRMASENYGYMAPIKAALDSSLAFLAKSFSRFSQVRFNAVAPGLLKTSASAGIPGYVDSYLYAEQVISAKAGRRKPRRPPTSPPFCSARDPAASTPSDRGRRRHEHQLLRRRDRQARDGYNAPSPFAPPKGKWYQSKSGPTFANSARKFDSTLIAHRRTQATIALSQERKATLLPFAPPKGEWI